MTSQIDISHDGKDFELTMQPSQSSQFYKQSKRSLSINIQREMVEESKLEALCELNDTQKLS